MHATATGSSHRRRQQHCEDAATAVTTERWTAVGVADGHGSARHPRARRGAELAVRTVTYALTELPDGTDDVPAELEQVPARLHRAWQEQVLADVDGAPLSNDEQAVVGGREPEHAWIAHGTTVLGAAASARWLALVQLGDGDIVVARAGSSGSSRPVRYPEPDDPRVTDSLCHRDAPRRTRTALLDLTAGAVDVVMLATDGFGAAFASRDWHDETARQLVAAVHGFGDDALGEALRRWCDEPAAVGGDDVALGLLVAREETSARPGLPGMPTTGEETA